MIEGFQKRYFAQLVPALAILAILEFLKRKEVIPADYTLGRTWEVINLVLAALFAIALPILYRLDFIRKVKDEKSIGIRLFKSFENNMIHVALVTPYLLIPNSLFEFNRFFMIGIAMLSLYACYYFYPSQNRIGQEMRVFRIQKENIKDEKETG